MADQTTSYGVKLNADATGLVGATGEASKAQAGLEDQFKKTTEASKAASAEAKNFVDRLKETVETLGKNRAEIERYRAGQVQMTEAQKASAAASIDQILAHDKHVQMLVALRTGLTAAAVAAIAYTTATAISVKQIIDERSELEHLSQSLGISTASLSAYRYAMSLANVSREEFEMGMKTLARTATEVQSGVGTGAQLFKLLGNEIYQAARQGSSLEELLPMIADKFSQFADGPNKTALALALFGRAGERLIPLLNQGASGFAAAAREAKEFGAIVGADAARQAEEFTNNLVRMNTMLSGMKQTIATDVVPALNAMIEKFIAARRAGEGFASSAVQAVQAGYAGPDDAQRDLVEAIDRKMAAENNLMRLQGIGGSAAARGRARAQQEIAQFDALIQVSRPGFFTTQGVAATASAQNPNSPLFEFAGGGIAPQAPVMSPDYQRLMAQAAEMSKMLDMQAGSTEKLTAADQALVELQSRQRQGLLGLNAVQYAAVEAAFKVDAQKARKIADTEREIALDEKYLQGLEQKQAEEQAHGDAVRVLVAGSADRIKQLEFETGLITSQTDRERAGAVFTTDRYKQIQIETAMIAANSAEREKAIAFMQIDINVQKAYVGATEAQIAAIDAKAAADKRALGAAIDAKVAAQQAHDAAEATRKEWQASTQRMSDNIERSLTDAIVRGFDKGKSFFENFKDVLVTEFKTLILAPIIQPIVRPVSQAMAAGVQGVIGGLGFGGGGGMGGAGLGLLGGLGAGQTMADFGNFFGSIGATTEAGGTFGLMDAVGGFAMANPWTAAAMIGGGLLLGGAFGGDGDAMRSGNWVGGLGQGGITDAHWFSSREMDPAINQFSTLQNTQEQNLIRNLKLGPGQIASVNAALAGTSGNNYQYGMEHTPVEQSGAFQQIQAARLQAISSALGQSIEELTRVMSLSADQWQAAIDQLQQAQQQAQQSIAQFARGLPQQLGITGLEGAQNALAIGAEGNAPLDRFSAARKQLTDVFGRAQGGDLSAVQSFPQVLQAALGVGRDVFASGPQFQDLFAEGNRMLSDLLGHQKDVQAEILKDIPAVIMQSGIDQIAALKQQTQTLVEKLNNIETQLRRMDIMGA